MNDLADKINQLLALPQFVTINIEGWGGETFPSGREWDVTLSRHSDIEWARNFEIKARAHILEEAIDDVMRQWAELDPEITHADD